MSKAFSIVKKLFIGHDVRNNRNSLLIDTCSSDGFRVDLYHSIRFCLLALCVLRQAVKAKVHCLVLPDDFLVFSQYNPYFEVEFDRVRLLFTVCD